MNRRGFISSVALAVLAPPLAAEAQQPAKTYRIGVIAMQAKEVFPLRQKYAAANHFNRPASSTAPSRGRGTGSPRMRG